MLLFEAAYSVVAVGRAMNALISTFTAVLLALTPQATASASLRAGLPIRGDGSPASRTLGLNIHNRDPSDHNLQLMGDAGLHWLRADGVTWKEMEPQPGQYNFSRYAFSIDRLSSHGHRVMTGAFPLEQP